MDVVIRRAWPAEARALTRVAHAAKRHWGYPEDWLRLWRDALTVTPAFIERRPVWCAVRGATVLGFYALSGSGILSMRGSIAVKRAEGKSPIWTLRYAKSESIELLRRIYYSPTLPCLARKRATAEPFLRPLGHASVRGVGRPRAGWVYN